MRPSRWQWAIAGVLASLVMLTLAYCSGVRRGAEDEKLKQNSVQIRTQDSVTKLVTRKADSSRKASDSVATRYTGIRYKVKIVHDTLIVHSGVNADTLVNSVVSNLILAADSTIAAQQRSLALQDTLVAALRQGIALRNVRIDILEHAKRPRLGFRSGLIVGAAAVIGLLAVTRR